MDTTPNTESDDTNSHGSGSKTGTAYTAVRWIVIPLVILGILAWILYNLFLDVGRAQAGGTVSLLFFDRNGTALTTTQVRSLSNNGGSGYDNDFLVNPVNLRAISSGPLFTSGSNLAFTIPSQAVALAFNWPTLPNGYSLVILDNQGVGFTTGGTINFTYQAARDTKKKLDSALATRADYVRSTKFTTAYQSAATH
jgi:hypothetical protein